MVASFRVFGPLWVVNKQPRAPNSACLQQGCMREARGLDCYKDERINCILSRMWKAIMQIAFLWTAFSSLCLDCLGFVYVISVFAYLCLSCIVCAWWIFWHSLCTHIYYFLLAADWLNYIHEKRLVLCLAMWLFYSTRGALLYTSRPLFDLIPSLSLLLVCPFSLTVLLWSYLLTRSSPLAYTHPSF